MIFAFAGWLRRLMEGSHMKRSRWCAVSVLASATMLVATRCPPQGGGTGSTNQAPTVAVSATPSSGTVPLSVAFNSAGTFDPEGPALTYSWNFGDGSPLDTSTSPTHIYAAVGTYTATLTAKDTAN